MIRQMLSPGEPIPNGFALRIAPVMAYAHWEGFVKEAASCYLLYLSNKSISLSRLRPCFQAIVCKSELMIALGSTKRIGPHLAIINRLVDRLAESVTLPTFIIDTESNLNWEVFENICNIVGIDLSTWSAYRGLIDDMFISRCDVAHGQLCKPGLQQAIDYLDFVISAISDFSVDLQNAATTESHLRHVDD